MGHPTCRSASTSTGPRGIDTGTCWAYSKDRPGALVGTHTVTMDDERTFEKMNVKSRVPVGWQTTFEVPPNGTTTADFDLINR